MPSLSVIQFRRRVRRLGTLAVCLMLGTALQPLCAAEPADPAPGAARPALPIPADPLENYYGNTLVCAAAVTGNDLCHLWLNRDGTFINFDQNGAHTGHYQVGPMRADGKVPVCQYWDTTNMLFLPGVAPPTMGPPPAAGATPGTAAVLVCDTRNFRSTCRHGVDPATLSAEERVEAHYNMAERFYHGMCYPLGPHNVGDIWFEEDDPLPGQAGRDKLLLLYGHQ